MAYVIVLILHLVSQSVKEVLQSLVDDGLVQADKIGSSNCTSSAMTPYMRPGLKMWTSLLELSIPARCHGQYFSQNHMSFNNDAFRCKAG